MRKSYTDAMQLSSLPAITRPLEPPERQFIEATAREERRLTRVKEDAVYIAYTTRGNVTELAEAIGQTPNTVRAIVARVHARKQADDR